ncbi:ABC transporter substrate-binding protein [Actinomadura hibisca]|uniref:ABC transporter substrate-binding protein n=1 Tax=Actinomadura hibisca TaxID=68565 RepID=UPI000831732D|nr:ABC transporter substrate-binding protein [Actinomadura hibisca]
MARRSLLTALAGVAALAIAATACAPQEDSSSSGASASPASCAKDQLKLVKAGQLTVATDKPAFEPWFKNNDPSNGEGFESAVAYAVAGKLGFAKNEVTWVTQSFDASYAPGPKNFDFDINQISVTPARQKAVTFSDGYYDVRQGVVTMGNGKFAGAKSLAELKDAKIGVQVGTTSLQAVRDQIKPGDDPKVFNSQIDVVNALKGKQVDAAVLDLPSAFYVTAAQVEGSKIVGQFDVGGGSGKEFFGLLLQQGNTLVGCLNKAIGELKSSGELAKIQDRWLTAAAGAPVLK